MKNLSQVPCFLVTLLISAAVSAGAVLDMTKEITEGAVDATKGVATTVGDTVTGGTVSPEQARSDVDQATAEALDRLFQESSAAKEQYDSSAGYAVFDTRKFSIMITTGMGAGVAVDKASGTRTYMKMATGGVNVGMGVKFFQVVFLFPNRETMEEFVNSGWSAGSDVGAQAGNEGVGLGLRLANGVIVHEINESGLAFSGSLTGTRYWKDDELN